jgi:hypothetical protein
VLVILTMVVTMMVMSAESTGYLAACSCRFCGVSVPPCRSTNAVLRFEVSHVANTQFSSSALTLQPA